MHSCDCQIENFILTVPHAVHPLICTDSSRNHDLCIEANAHLVPIPAACNVQVSHKGTPVAMHLTSFSDRTWTSSLQSTFCIKLYLQVAKCFCLLISLRLWPSMMWCYVVWYLSTRLHGVTSLKTIILIFSTVRTTDLLEFYVFTYAFFCHLQL